jgi:hypothetical protein
LCAETDVMSCCTPTWRGRALVRTDSDSGLTSRLLHGRQAAASDCDVCALEGLCYAICVCIPKQCQPRAACNTHTAVVQHSGNTQSRSLFVHCIVSVAQLARLAHYIDERSVLAVIHVLCHHTCYALDAQLVSPAVANLAKRTNSATPAQAHGGPVPLCTHCGLG